MSSLPSGALTFLLTDIEGSTRLWEADPQAMRRALSRHNALIATSIRDHAGTVLRDRGEGDSFFAIFRRPEDGLAAALVAQQAMTREPWPAEAPLKVRMALHSGEAEPGFWHPVINRCARLRSLAHGGQTLLSAATEAQLRDSLPADVQLRSLGQHRLRDLARPEMVYQLSHPSLPSDFPRLASVETFPNNLPIQLTRFIGREQEVAYLKQQLSKTSLLTLIGTAGCGKTRVALQVAAELLDEYPNGVWLVEFAPMTDAELVPHVVASTLHIREEPGQALVETLISNLHGQRVLLILDNCEHLVTACAKLADGLLRECPQLHILATSREALGVVGEASRRIPSLGLPSLGVSDKLDEVARSEAVQLFIDRARLSRPDFALNETNASAVAEVCQRLDGIPLAIELAAARVRMMPPGEILDRLQDRFHLLTLGSRTALPRQQTLHAAVEWSYRLLSEPEQLLFDRLSVFAGGFTLDAAEAVCADGGLSGDLILDLLSALVDKSLIMVGEDSGGRSRYALLETLRQYGRERLAQAGEREIRMRHATYYLGVALETEPHLMGPAQATRLQQLEDDHDNFRAALRCFADFKENEPALNLASAMVQFWLMRGHVTEGRQWLAGQLEGSSAAPAIRAKAALGQGRLAWRQADYVVATSSFEDSLAIWRDLGDKAGIARALNGLGTIYTEQGDQPAGLSYFEESLSVAREAGDRRAIARVLSNLASLAFQSADYASAHSIHLQALALHEEIGDRGQVALTKGNLAETLLEQHDHAGAWSRYRESLALFRELGDQVGIAFALDGFSALASAHGQPETALRLAGAAEAQREVVGSIVYPAARLKLESRLAPARHALGPSVAAVAFSEGSEMGLDQAVDEALAVEVSHPLTAP